jgi:hypothetical protein
MVELTPMTIRLDKKCGRSGVAENVKCSKPLTTERLPRKRLTAQERRERKTRAAVTAVAVGGAAALLLHARGRNRAVSRGRVSVINATDRMSATYQNNLRTNAVQNSIERATRPLQQHPEDVFASLNRRAVVQRSKYYTFNAQDRKVRAALTLKVRSSRTPSRIADNEAAVKAAFSTPTPTTSSSNPTLPDREKLVAAAFKRVQP